MKFHYISDIHLELQKHIKIDKFSCFKNLFLLGDIGRIDKPEYHKFIKEYSNKFENVFVILGNHEYYSTKYTMCDLEKMCIFPPNTHLLQNSKKYINLDNNEVSDIKKEGNYIKLIGSTLWSNITNKASNQMNDYYMIYSHEKQKLTPAFSRELFITNKKYILKELEENIPTLLLTHHGVHPLCNGKYMGNITESAYATEIPELKNFKHLKACFNGHTHVHLNTVIPNTNIKLLSNCYGYFGENTKFVNDTIYEYK